MGVGEAMLESFSIIRYHACPVKIMLTEAAH